jgi:tRNA-modifying protein YgfZ
MNVSSHGEILPWRPATWCRVAGADSAHFLQGQFTNDLRQAAPNRAVYGLWLNVKGKVVADSFVLRGASSDEFWIGSYRCTAATIRERLESFIIADDVVVDDLTSDWSALAVYGSEAASKIAAAAKTLPGTPLTFTFEGRRSRQPQVEWVFPIAAEAAARAAMGGCAEITDDEAERRRIDSGIPAIPADIGTQDLPNEGGLESDAISYTKGCYLGQEVMARLKTMGQVRRRLLRVAGGTASIPPLPAPLFVGERQVGELRSAVPTTSGNSLIGLAMLSLLHVKPDTMFAFAPNTAPVLQVLQPS